jgi:hypothetical protein
MGMNCYDELRRLFWNTLYGGVKAKRLLVGKRKRGEEFNKPFGFLRLYGSSIKSIEI